LTAGIGENKQIKVRTNYRHNSWSQSSILKQVLGSWLVLILFHSYNFSGIPLKKGTSLVFIAMLELTCYLEFLEVSWMKK